jgi:copper chaperone CopZ
MAMRPAGARSEAMPTARVVLDVPALCCEGCVSSAAMVLEQLSNVQVVGADVDAHQLTVDYDLSLVTPKALVTQLAAVGYPVTRSHAPRTQG